MDSLCVSMSLAMLVLGLIVGWCWGNADGVETGRRDERNQWHRATVFQKVARWTLDREGRVGWEWVATRPIEQVEKHPDLNR